MKVGYIGLGALGSQLALRLVPEHELMVWDRSSDAVARLCESGARGATTAQEIAHASDIVVMCLPRSADVQSVLFAEGGLASSMAPGKIVVDQTSGIPGETRAMAEQLARNGIAMVDAAVSASPQVVSLGQTKLMTSGPADVLARVQPVLRAITETIYHCGKHVGDAQAMKTVNNAMNAGCRIGTLEIAALGRKLGLSLAIVTEALHASGGRNITTERMLPNIAQGKQSTDFALSLMLKDLNQALGLGLQTRVPLPMSSIVRATLQIGANTLGPQARLEDMIGVVESLSGTQLRPGPADSADAAASMDAAPQLETLASALQAICWIISLECIAAGLQYGLEIERMQDVLHVSSGWSDTGRQLLAQLARAEPVEATTVRTAAHELRQASELGAQAGVPLLLANAARMQFETLLHAHDAGAAGDILALYQPISST